MPLSQEQIQQRRNMSAEASRDQDLYRIADATEEIADTLNKIQQELFQIRGQLKFGGK
jgi:hypothetical protein